MIDVTTKQPLRVSTDGTAGPYVLVPVTQLDAVCQALDSRGVRYWVEDEVISLNGAPETAAINLGRGTDAQSVQALLDSIR
jgi:hypothetical protein